MGIRVIQLRRKDFLDQLVAGVLGKNGSSSRDHRVRFFFGGGLNQGRDDDSRMEDYSRLEDPCIAAFNAKQNTGVTFRLSDPALLPSTVFAEAG